MSQAMNAGKYVSIGVGRQTEAYGAWYEGEQAKNYYSLMSTLNMQKKEEARRNIQIQELEAGLVKDQAAVAFKEAEYTGQLNKVKEQKFQEASDKGVSAMFSKMAKSGVAMNFGSPMDYIDEAVTERAKDLDLLKWTGKEDVWQKEVSATNISNKATIMLDQAKVAESQLPMFDYQNELYAAAGKEAGRVAWWKQFSAFLGAFSDVFGGSSGGVQGGGGGSYSGNSGGGGNYLGAMNGGEG